MKKIFYNFMIVMALTSCSPAKAFINFPSQKQIIAAFVVTLSFGVGAGLLIAKLISSAKN